MLCDQRQRFSPSFSGTEVCVTAVQSTSPEDITATEKLIVYCVEHDILPEYLLDRREEVTSMVDVIFDDSIHQVFEEPERDAVFILWIKMWITRAYPVSK